MAAEIHWQVAELLLDMEAELRRLQLWSAEAPAPAALASQQPFCIDTLCFSEWLQFIFLPRMHQLTRQQQPLPTSSAITPMAEHYFQTLQLDSAALLEILRSMDTLLEQQK